MTIGKDIGQHVTCELLMLHTETSSPSLSSSLWLPTLLPLGNVGWLHRSKYATSYNDASGKKQW